MKKKKSRFAFLPNALTLANLFFGCIAIVFLFEENIQGVLWALIISNVCDFLDGAVARALGVSGELGKQLDSLADAISFGVVPGFMMYFMLIASCQHEEHWLCNFSYLPYLGFAITLSSAYRLGKFNLLETGKTEGFIGLPTPANTLFFLGFYILVMDDTMGLQSYFINPLLLLLMTFLFAYLLNSSVEMFKLKMGPLRWKGMRRQWILLIGSLLGFWFLGAASLAFIIVLYMLLSLSTYIQFGR